MPLHSETLPVLRLLSDGMPRTVGALGDAIGLPPERVRSVIEQLADQGLDLQVDRVEDTIGLRAPVHMLDAARILEHLRGTAAVTPVVHVLDQCTSTNDVLRDLAMRGAISATSVTCEVQTGGRGRRGRKWVAPPGSSVALSVLWRFACNVQELAGLSLAAAVAVADALDRCGAPAVSIKWPNDLLLAGAKVGGILVETVTIERECVAIIGVGVNLHLGHTARAMIDSLGDVPAFEPAALTHGSAGTPDRNRLVAALIDELTGACAVFAHRGLAPFRGPWRARHAFQSAEVTIATGSDSIVTGRAVDIADDGALVLDTAQGPRRFHAGEVSLRA